MAPSASFQIYNQNSYAGSTLQTASQIVITSIAVGPQGPIGPTGAKTFVIEHPIKSNHYLVHACLEGPEAGVYYRGKSFITDKYITIKLPEYVDAFSHNFTVHITPERVVSDTEESVEFTNLFTTPIVNNKFRIYASSSCMVHWVVFGSRKSVTLQVEAPYDSVSIKGEGPYKWV